MNKTIKNYVSQLCGPTYAVSLLEKPITFRRLTQLAAEGRVPAYRTADGRWMFRIDEMKTYARERARRLRESSP